MANTHNALLYVLTPSLTIEELAERSGFSARTIRNYRDKGLIDPPGSRNGRKSLFSLSHVEQLQRVKRQRDQGLTLAEIGAGVYCHQKAGGVASGETQSRAERLVRVISVLPGVCVHVEDPMNASQRRALKILRRAIREAQSKQAAAAADSRGPKPESGRRS